MKCFLKLTLRKCFLKIQILGEQAHFYPNLFILHYNLSRIIERWNFLINSITFSYLFSALVVFQSPSGYTCRRFSVSYIKGAVSLSQQNSLLQDLESQVGCSPQVHTLPYPSTRRAVVTRWVCSVCTCAVLERETCGF